MIFEIQNNTYRSSFFTNYLKMLIPHLGLLNLTFCWSDGLNEQTDGYQTSPAIFISNDGLFVMQVGLHQPITNYQNLSGNCFKLETNSNYTTFLGFIIYNQSNLAAISAMTTMKTMTINKNEIMYESMKYPCIQNIKICDQFDKQFTLQKNLKTELVHEKVKYPCHQCEYKATRQGSLKKHIE